MLLGGDELGRTQGGNNNAYCQDSPLSWYDWAEVDRELLTGPSASSPCAGPIPCSGGAGSSRAARCAARAAGRPAARHRLVPHRRPADDRRRLGGRLRQVARRLPQRQGHPGPDVHGRPIVDDSFYLLFNGWDQEIDFTLPPARWAWSWDVVLDTRGPAGRRRAGASQPGVRPAAWSGFPDPACWSCSRPRPRMTRTDRGPEVHSGNI